MGRPGAAKSAPTSTEAWLAARDESGRFTAAALLEHEEWAALVPSLERVAADPSKALPRLADYLALVLGWNRTVSNLISRSDENRLVSRHLAESLAPAAELAASGANRWIDLGSGAGFPALPLAIVGVGAQWLLVESRRPKTLFLRRVVQDLGIQNVFVAHARLEELIAREKGGESDADAIRAGGFPFDAFTSRATMTLPPTLDMATDSIKHGGEAFLWKGSGRSEEKATNEGWRNDWSDAGEIELGSGQVAVCRFILNN